MKGEVCVVDTSVMGVPRRQDLTTRGYPESVRQDLSPVYRIMCELESRQFAR